MAYLFDFAAANSSHRLASGIAKSFTSQFDKRTSINLDLRLSATVMAGISPLSNR
jgi:hypothetical protein